MSTLTVAGFSSPGINGVYTSCGTHDGQTVYKKSTTSYFVTTTYYLRYYTEWMPWSMTAGYYLIKTNDISTSSATNQDVIPIESPKYYIAGTAPTATSWIPLMGPASGETTIGTVA